MGDFPIPEFIEKLSDGDLRKELVKNGVSAGPITPTTRRVLKTRLAKKLGAISAFQTNQDSNDDGASSKSKSPDNSNQRWSLLKDVQRAGTPLKLSESSPTRDQSGKQLFYGVFIPKTEPEIENNEALVFENQSTALLTIKGHKNARFKVFKTFDEAKEYSLKGVEDKNGKTTSNSGESEEIGNIFPSLKQGDLNKLMRSIESGNLEQMRTLIWSNPKYLISSADGPVVLKPNTRYNALHIAAKSNQPEICREVLTLIENPVFQALMFPNVEDEIVNKHRTQHLIDLYLNTPEKILYETPLHFACKLGYKDVVSELVSYAQCSTTAQNKSDKTPGEITCSRASPNMKINQVEIHRLLGDQYYVPLLRYHDNSEHAIVGTPITAKQHSNEITTSSPTSRISSLLNVGESPLRPSLAVSAVAGPMLKEQAVHFQKVWTTPSKHKNFGKSVRYIRRADSEKGDEQIGRQLAEMEHIGWLEYWDFLSDFANFSTEEGLGKLEFYLREKMPVLSPPKPSLSKDISELADMLGDIRLNKSAENLHSDGSQTDIKKPSDSENSKSSGSYSSYDTAPENVTSQQSQEKDEIFQTPKSHPTETTPSRTLLNESGPVSTDSDTKTSSEDANLVKKLFTDTTVENVTDVFSKSLSLEPKNDNWFGNNGVSTYRSVDQSYSDVFSTPSNSDISTNSSSTEVPPKSSQDVFLAGPAPTKLDRDVLIAIGDADIDMQKFPCIIRWKCAILSFSENDRQKWATPRKERSFSFNPNNAYSTSNGHASPFSPAPSSGRINPLLTPNRDMRRFLYKPFTPPNAR